MLCVMLVSLDHTVIAVRDLEQATERYTSLLGLAPSWRGGHPEAGTANTLYRLGNVYLELLAPLAQGGSEGIGGVVAERIERAGEGLFAVCFGVDDADAFAAAMRARGVAANGPNPGEGRSDHAEAVCDALRRWRTVLLPPDATRGLTLFAIEHESPTDSLPVAKPTGDAAAAVLALDHVVVHSRNLDASRALYGDTLGLRLSLDRSFAARGLRMLFFRVGGVTVEVVGALDASAEPDAPAAAEAPDRFGGLAYQVRDAGAVHRRLAAEGVDVSEVRDGHKPGTRVLTVRDGTCGVPTLLIEPTTPFRG